MENTNVTTGLMGLSNYLRRELGITKSYKAEIYLLYIWQEVIYKYVINNYKNNNSIYTKGRNLLERLESLDGEVPRN